MKNENKTEKTDTKTENNEKKEEAVMDAIEKFDGVDETNGNALEKVEERFDMVDVKASFETMKPMIESVPEEYLQPLPVSVILAVGNAFRTAHSFIRDRQMFVAKINTDAFDPADYEDLPDLAKAFLYIDFKIRQCLNMNLELPGLIEVAKPLHAKLLRAGIYLWEFDPVLGEFIAQIRTGRSRNDMIHDIGNMATLFEARWEQVKNSCEVTAEDLRTAQSISLRIIDVLNSDAAETETDKWKSLRDRAVYLLKKYTDDIRLAATFVHNNDPAVAERYPNLLSGRNTRRASRPSDAPASSEEEAQATEEKADTAPQTPPLPPEAQAQA